MATWIAHLQIAENLLGMIDDLDPPWFAIGNIAPDSGIPDENWENFTPPGHVTHFKSEQNHPYACEDLRFYRQYLAGLTWPGSNPDQFSFLLGYFFHLVTDNLWSIHIGRPTQERFKDEFDADPQFIWEVKRDWYGLDLIYVRDHPESLFWQVFLNCQYTQSCLDFMPPEAVHQRIIHIQEFYQRKDERVLEAYKRPYIYLSQEEYDAFIDEATRIMYAAYEKTIKTNADMNHSSILEMLI